MESSLLQGKYTLFENLNSIRTVERSDKRLELH